MTTPFAAPRAVGPGWFVKPGVKIRSIDSKEAFGTPLVAIWQTVLVGAGIASGEAVSAPNLRYDQFITGITGIPTAEAFGGSSSAPGPVNILTQGIASGEAFGTAVVGRGPVGLSPSAIDDGGSQMGGPGFSNLPNIMLDPTFEIGIPAYQSSTTVGSGRTTAHYRSGTTSFKMVSGGPAGNGRFYFQRGFADNGSTHQYIDVVVGDLVYLEFWIKKDAGNTGVPGFNVYVATLDNDLSNPAYPILGNIRNADLSSTDWTFFSYIYRHTDPTRTKLNFFLQNESSGTAGDAWYIDDVQLVRTFELGPVSSLENLHTDPNTENPALWVNTMAGGYADVSLSSEYVFQGKTSVKWVKTAAAGTGDAYMFLASPTSPPYLQNTLTPGDVVEAAMMVYVPSSSPYRDVRLYIRLRDTAGNGLPNQDYVVDSKTVPYDTWTELKGRVQVPPGYNSAQTYYRPSAISNAPLGTTVYFSNIYTAIERYGYNTLENQIAPLSITAQGDFVTDPQILRPELWKVATGGDFEVVQEDGENALLFTKTYPVGSYPQFTPIRSILGNNAAMTNAVSPGDTIDFWADAKPHPDNVSFENATSRFFMQANITDSTGVNPTIYVGSGSPNQVPGVWARVNRLNYTIPAGYDRIDIRCYILHLAETGTRFYVKNIYVNITYNGNHAIVPGPVNISPASFVDSSAMGGSIVSPGAATVGPQAIFSGETFGAVGVGASQPLYAAPTTDDIYEDWESDDLFFDPNVSIYANVDNTVSYSGTKSLRFDPTPSSSYVILEGKFRVFDVQEGDIIRVSLRAMRDADYNGDDSKIRIGVGNSGGTAVPSWAEFRAAALPTPGVWYLRKADAVVPAGVSQIGFNLRNRATAGKVWVDELRIEKISIGELTAVSVGPVGISNIASATNDIVSDAEGSMEFQPWWMESLGSNASWDTTVFKSGTRSLKITSGGGSVPGAVVVGTNPNITTAIPVSAGEVYDMTFWVRRDSAFNGLNGNSKIRVAKSDTNTIIAAGEFGLANIPVADTWVQIATSFAIPSGTTGVRVQYLIDANAGNIWIDDVQISLRQSPVMSLTPGPVNIAPPATDDGNIFSTPTMTVGPVGISPTGIDDSSTVGTPAISVAAWPITASGIDDGGSQMGTPTVAPGGVSLFTTGIDDGGSVVGTPSRVYAPQVVLQSAGAVSAQTKISNTSHTINGVVGPVVPAGGGTYVLVLILGYKTSSSSMSINMTYGGVAMTGGGMVFGSGSNSSNTSWSQWFWIETSASEQTIAGTISTPAFASPRFSVMSWCLTNTSGVAQTVSNGNGSSGTACSLPTITTQPGSVIMTHFMQEPISGSDDTTPTNVQVNGSSSGVATVWSGLAEANCTGIVSAFSSGGSKSITAERMSGHDWAGSAVELTPIAA